MGPPDGVASSPISAEPTCTRRVLPLTFPGAGVRTTLPCVPGVRGVRVPGVRGLVPVAWPVRSRVVLAIEVRVEQ